MVRQTQAGFSHHPSLPMSSSSLLVPVSLTNTQRGGGDSPCGSSISGCCPNLIGAVRSNLSMQPPCSLDPNSSDNYPSGEARVDQPGQVSVLSSMYGTPFHTFHPTAYQVQQQQQQHPPPPPLHTYAHAYQQQPFYYYPQVPYYNQPAQYTYSQPLLLPPPPPPHYVYPQPPLSHAQPVQPIQSTRRQEQQTTQTVQRQEQQATQIVQQPGQFVQSNRSVKQNTPNELSRAIQPDSSNTELSNSSVPFTSKTLPIRNQERLYGWVQHKQKPSSALQLYESILSIPYNTKMYNPGRTAKKRTTRKVSKTIIPENTSPPLGSTPTLTTPPPPTTHQPPTPITTRLPSPPSMKNTSSHTYKTSNPRENDLPVSRGTMNIESPIIGTIGVAPPSTDCIIGSGRPPRDQNLQSAELNVVTFPQSLTERSPTNSTPTSEGGATTSTQLNYSTMNSPTVEPPTNKRKSESNHSKKSKPNTDFSELLNHIRHVVSCVACGCFPTSSRLLECGHIYCAQCLSNAIIDSESGKSRQSCPKCRTVLTRPSMPCVIAETVSRLISGSLPSESHSSRVFQTSDQSEIERNSFKSRIDMGRQSNARYMVITERWTCHEKVSLSNILQVCHGKSRLSSLELTGLTLFSVPRFTKEQMINASDNTLIGPVMRYYTDSNGHSSCEVDYEKTRLRLLSFINQNDNFGL